MFSINFKLQNNDSLYSKGRGYGFFTPEMAVTSSGTAHEQSLKSGGWNTRHFYEEVSDEGEEEDNNSQDVKDEEDVKEENEYENSIKNLNNKKIKLMKISRKNKKKEKTDTSINIHKENIESNIKEGNLTKIKEISTKIKEISTKINEISKNEN